MASQQKELVSELGKLRAEASSLKNALNELDKEKESWFSKKEEISKKIRELIQKIKENKTKRDALTSEVKELKPKRDSINKEVGEKLKELDKSKKEKTELEKSLGLRESPSKIKQHIDRLEFKIETETSSFEKEKELRKLYENSAGVVDIGKKIKGISDEIRKLRKEANEIHKVIQEKAKESQALHEEILKLSAEIDRLKVEEENAFKNFSGFKQKFGEMNSKLKEKLKAMNEVKSHLDRIDTERWERRKQEEASFLKSKEEAVNAKIKRREKLKIGRASCRERV